MLPNQMSILLLTTVYFKICSVIGAADPKEQPGPQATNPAVYNPCSALTQSSSWQEHEKAQLYCRTVHSRAISDHVSGINDLCPDSINPGCTPQRRTAQGTKYICTVEVRSTFISLAILGQSHCRYDLLYCVPDPAFWKPLKKSQVELRSLERLKDNFSVGYFSSKKILVTKRGFGLVTENAGAYATRGSRPYMEDSFNINEDIADSTPKVSFFAVYDGHGGQFAVKYALQNLWKNLRDKIISVKKMVEQRSSKPDIFSTEKKDICVPNDQVYLMKGGKINYGPLLHDVILALDEALLAAAKETDDNSGSTVVIALIEESRLFIANVGDSRAVMCDSLGNAIQLSIDHKPADEKEKKSIEDAGGYVAFFEGLLRAGGYLAMSRALGDAHLKDKSCLTAKPDVFSFDLSYHQPQFIILASDGLWDVFTNEEAVAFLAGRESEENMGAESLVIYAFLRGSTDNITVMVINLRNRTWSRSERIRPPRMAKPLHKTYRKRTVEAPQVEEEVQGEASGSNLEGNEPTVTSNQDKEV